MYIIFIEASRMYPIINFNSTKTNVEIYDIYNNVSKKVQVYQDDNYENLFEQIQKAFVISSEYILILDNNGYPLTFQYGMDKINIHPNSFSIIDTKFQSTSKFINLSKNFISVKSCNLLSLIDCINIENNIKFLTDYELGTIFNNTVSKLWPYIIYEDFKAIIHNGKISNPNIPIRNTSEQFYSIMSSITIPMIKKALIIDYPIKTSLVVKTYFSENINLMYLFDQFKITDEFPDIFYSVSKSKTFYKHFSNVDKKKNTLRFPNMIKIGNDTIIQDNWIQYTNKNIVKVVSDIIEGNKIIYSNNDNKFIFSIQFYDGKVLNINNFNKVIQNFSTNIIERDVKNFGNPNDYICRYKRTESLEGTLINIRGKNLVNIMIREVRSDYDLINTFNFLLRVFYIYNDKEIESSHERRISVIKGRMKSYDPVLYNFHKKDLYGTLKIYTRKLAKNRYPIIFPEKSDILDQYREDYHAKHGHNPPELKYKNFTIPGKNNIYICPDNKYSNFIFRRPNEHPGGLCMISCGAKVQKNTDLIKKCMNGKPFLMDELVREEDTSNMFYIRQFTPDKNLQKDKLSRLPEVLEKLFNEKCAIENNTLETGNMCYLLRGSNDDRDFNQTIEYIFPNVKKFVVYKDESIHKQWDFIYHYYKYDINIMIIEYNTDSGIINLINFIEYDSLIKVLNKMQTVVIVKIVSDMNNYERFNIISKLETFKRKEYKKYMIFDKDTPIVKTMIRLVERLRDKRDEKFTFLAITDLVSMGLNFIQVREPYTNAITFVYIKDYELYMPITVTYPYYGIEHLDNIEFEEMYNYVKMNTQEKVIKYLNILNEKVHNMNITAALCREDGLYIGFELNGEYFVKFNESKKLLIPGLPISVLHYNPDTEPYTIKDNTFAIDKELYETLLLHISYYINETSKEVITKEKILKFYNNDTNNPLFIQDYNNWNNKNYDKINMLKRNKHELENLIDVEKKLHTIMDSKVNFVNIKSIGLTNNKYRNICGEETTYSIDHQCNGRKLNIPRDRYNIYIKLIAKEIVFNEIKRNDIFNYNVANITNPRSFSKQKDVVVETIYVIDELLND